MTSAVIIFSAADLSAKRGCERRGTYSHPHSAGGTALSFLGSTRFQLRQKPLRGLSKRFHSLSGSFHSATASYVHLAIGGVGNVRKGFGEIQNVEC